MKTRSEIVKTSHSRVEQGADGLTPFLLLPFLLMAGFYLQYAFQAWFYQDDFGLLGGYKYDWQWSQIINMTDFGRFVSRNVYWHVLSQIFGSQAQYYFLTDFAIVCASSILLFQIFRLFVSFNAALVGSFVYFAAPAVLKNYSWISGSQHLLPDLFVFLFVLIYVRRDGVLTSWPEVIFLLVVELLGLWSNVYAGSVITLPLVYLAMRQPLRKNSKHWTLVGVGLFLILYFYIRLRPFSTGNYAVDYSPHILTMNLSFYFHGYFWFYLFVMLACGALGVLRKSPLNVWFFVGAVASYLPYAFLIRRHTVSYMSLTATLFLAGVWFTVATTPRWKKLPLSVLAALAILCLTVFPRPSLFLNPWNSTPVGVESKSIVASLVAYQQSNPATRRYCFTVVPAAARIKVKGNVPQPWSAVNSGHAFSFFANPSDAYRLVLPGASTKGCQIVGLLTTTGIDFPSGASSPSAANQSPSGSSSQSAGSASSGAGQSSPFAKQ